jgi:hypothetical protein
MKYALDIRLYSLLLASRLIFEFVVKHALLCAQASSPNGINWILIYLHYGLKSMDIIDRNYVYRYHANDLSLRATVVAPLVFECLMLRDGELQLTQEFQSSDDILCLINLLAASQMKVAIQFYSFVLAFLFLHLPVFVFVPRA